jgi:hypothetical protein
MTQKISVQFFDPADAKEVNARVYDILPVGIYDGGYLAKVTDASVTLSPFSAEISDGTYQVKDESNASEAVAVSIATPYVIIRWVYAESPSNVALLLGVALGSIQATDLVVGRCVYTGSIMTGFDYSLRSVPDTHQLFLKVIPTVPASMAVRIMPGKVSYGVSNHDIIDQQSSTLIAPTSNPRIDVVYVDTDGIVKVYTGTEAATPVAPGYNGKTALAEITLTVGMTTITKASIKDVRAFLSGGGYAIYAP